MLSLKNNRTGFTVIELIGVLVVMGILISFVTVQTTNLKKKERDADRRADLSNLQMKLVQYNASKASYPSALSDMGDLPADILADEQGNKYTYSATTSDNKTCTTAAANCSQYKLSSDKMERVPNPYTVSSN